MNRAIDSENHDSETYVDILRAFGWALVEFEDTLYNKYLVMSAKHSLLPREEFNRQLLRMHARGLISPLRLHGHKAWKKLVVEDTAGQGLVARTIETEDSAERRPAHYRRFMVSDSRILAEDILRTMKTKLYPERDLDQVREDIKRHAAAMRRALCSSRNEFLRYLDEKAPSLRELLSTILSSKGEDVLLVSLRLIETHAA